MDQVQSYTDLHHLAELRTQARENPDASIKQVAAQFESIFVQLMMSSMRDASVPLESGLFSSNQSKMYEQMLDQQLSLNVSQGGGFGLAEVIERQLSGYYSSSETSDKEPTSTNPLVEIKSIQPKAVPVSNDSGQESASYGIQSLAEIIASSEPDGSSRSNGIEANFIEDIWPHADWAANKLNVSPSVIIAQAALETGWGQKVIKNPDGSSSHNIFGIKAGSQWSGKTALHESREVLDGSDVIQESEFRSYASIEEAMQDYLDFLSSNDRYSQLQGAETSQYAKTLQDSGYATDPEYADKILGILSRTEVNDALAYASSNTSYGNSTNLSRLSNNINMGVR